MSHLFFTDYTLTVDETVSLVASTAPVEHDCGCKGSYSTETEAPSPASVRWSGVLGVEGELTGDGRYIQPEALRWEDLPVPLRYVPADTGAHQGAVVVGRIDEIERHDDGTIWGSGDFDMASQYGPEAARQVKEQYQNGVSLDLDDVAFEVRIAADAPALMTTDPKELAKTGTPDEDGRVKVQEMSPDDEVMVTTDARVRAATIVAVPAFNTAKISLADDTTEDDFDVEEYMTSLGEENRELLDAAAAAFNWVDDVGGLPKYIHRIVDHLKAKGMDEGHAIAVAVNVVKKACATGDLNFPGKQSENKASQAEACSAVDEWEAKKAQANSDSASTDEFDVKHAPPGPGGGRFIGPGGGAGAGKDSGPQGSGTQPRPQPKSKAERVRLLTRQIDKELDALMANLNDRRAIAFVKNLRNNAAKIINAQVQNAPSHPAGSSGGKSTTGGKSGGKATTVKSGGQSKPGSSGGSSSGGSSSSGSSGSPSLDGMVQGLIAGIEKAVKTFDLKLGPKEKSNLQDLTQKLSQTVGPQPKRFTVGGVTFNSSGEILPTVSVTTFGYSKDQWRNPHDGKWIDMPDKSLSDFIDLLKEKAPDIDLSNLGSAKKRMGDPSKTRPSNADLLRAEAEVKATLIDVRETAEKSGMDPTMDEDLNHIEYAGVEALNAIQAYQTSYIPEESTDIGAGDTSPPMPLAEDLSGPTPLSAPAVSNLSDLPVSAELQDSLDRAQDQMSMDDFDALNTAVNEKRWDDAKQIADDNGLPDLSNALETEADLNVPLGIHPLSSTSRQATSLPGVDALAANRQAGRPDGTGTETDPIAVGDDLNRAAQLLAEGKHIRLSRVDEVGTLLDKLTELVNDAKAKGEEAPTYDLCLVSVPATNLFCAENKGIPRPQMPQLAGFPRPGSAADALPRTSEGGVDATAQFMAALKDRGIGTVQDTVPAASLKATQNQLDGPKVAKISASMEKNGIQPGTRLFVTRDGYIIDGHHRWAAMVALDAKDGHLGDIPMDVEILDMDIGEAIDFTNSFTHDFGIEGAQIGANADVPVGESVPAPPLANAHIPLPNVSDLTGMSDAQFQEAIQTAIAKVRPSGVPGKRDPQDPNADVEGMDRLGNCYEYSAQYVLDNPGSTLVHGTIEGAGQPPLSHAWVIRSDGNIFEPGTGSVMTSAEFIDFFHPVAEDTYSDEQARVEMVTHEHYGPWTDREQVNAAGLDPDQSISQYIGSDGYLTPQRQALHDRIVAETLAKGTPSDYPQFVILGGGPASGKSTMIRSGVVPVPEGSITVAADDYKELLPEYQAGVQSGDSTIAGKVHQESQILAARIQREAVARHIPVVLDSTGNTSAEVMRQRIELARAQGYQIIGDYATIPTDLAVTRMLDRGKETGRYVPEAALRESHASVSQIFEEITPLFDDLTLYDTSSDLRVRPIFQYRDGKREILDQRKYDLFLAKAQTAATTRPEVSSPTDSIDDEKLAQDVADTVKDVPDSQTILDAKNWWDLNQPIVTSETDLMESKFLNPDGTPMKMKDLVKNATSKKLSPEDRAAFRAERDRRAKIMRETIAQKENITGALARAIDQTPEDADLAPAIGETLDAHPEWGALAHLVDRLRLAGYNFKKKVTSGEFPDELVRAAARAAFSILVVFLAIHFGVDLTGFVGGGE